jgi:hypothetical protein
MFLHLSMAGIMLVYLMCLRGFVTVMSYLVPWRCLALGLVGLATTATSLVAGFSLHHDDIPVWLFWLRYKRFGSLSFPLSPLSLFLSAPYNDEISFCLFSRGCIVCLLVCLCLSVSVSVCMSVPISPPLVLLYKDDIPVWIFWVR